VTSTGLLGQPQTLLGTRTAARAAAAQFSYLTRALPLVEQDVQSAVRAILSGSYARSTRIMPLSGVFDIDIVPTIVNQPGGHVALVVRRQHAHSTAALQEPDVLSRLTAIRDLIQKDHILTARRMLDLIPAAASEEPAVARLRRVLTPPTVRPSARTDVSRSQAYEWLRRHAHEHRGRWVALGEDGLIASAPTLKELRTRLETLAPAQQPLIHKL
jgi:hypothetical protein